MVKYKISFIGAGNVGVALCNGLIAAGQSVISVSSKNGTSAQRLARKAGASWLKDYSIPDDCDIVILAVSDNAIRDVAEMIPPQRKVIIVHTAGSVGLDALQRSSGAGVLYPLQTFSKGFNPDLSRVPFFIEATDPQTLQILQDIGNLIGSGTYLCDSDRRRYLHLAAVFINNFSNFMMTTGEDLAQKAGFDTALLRPLMRETARKTMKLGPKNAQTGPAVRHDFETIENHIDLLSFSPEYQDLYKSISFLISEYYKK